MDDLPNLKGSAIVLDDNSERIYPMRIRPRFTWHGGEAPTAVQKNKELYIKARNEIKKGQFIEILDHQNKSITKIKVKNIFNINKNEQIKSAHNTYYIKIPCLNNFPYRSIIRAKITNL